MDPATIALLIGAVAPIVSKAIGDAISKGDKDKAMQLATEAAQKYKSVVVPGLRKMGQHQQANALASTAGAEGRSAQSKALDLLGQEVDTNGNSPQDIQAFQRARGQAGAMDTGLRQAAAQRAAQTGQGGTQSEYVSSLLGGQAAANMGAQMTGDAAAAASDRRMKALGMLGEQGGSMRSGDYRAAAAQDDINKFNTTMGFDVDKFNAGQVQQNYNNQMGLADKQAQGLRDEASIYAGRAGETGKDAATYGAQVGQLGNAVAGAVPGKKKPEDE